MSAGRDENISGAKIQPLESAMKSNVAHDMSARGAVGTDHNIGQARIDPLGGTGHHPHPHHLHAAPHANSQGVVGREEVFAGAKIAPLDGKEGPLGQRMDKIGGLDDEVVDSTRIDPMGEVLEE